MVPKVEVYALFLNWDEQLNEGRAFHYDDPPITSSVKKMALKQWV